jgi:hypothetical protein
MQSRFIQSILVLLSFFLIFFILRSQQFMAVDGAIGCFQVFKSNTIYFHGNNHLLYPFNVFLWSRFISILGYTAGGPLEFISLTQIMNCLAGAGCISIIYWLCHIVTSSVRISLGVVIGTGFSKAFLLHATNSAEPIVGLFWSLLAILVTIIALQKRWAWMIFFAGLLLSLAMASYQSMILIGLVVAFLCLKWPSIEKRYLYLLCLIIGGLFGVVAIYGTAYFYSGTYGLSAMIDRFITLKGKEIYGSIELRKIVSFPIALVRNTFNTSTIPGTALILLGTIFFTFINFSQGWKSYRSLSEEYKLALLCAALGLLATIAVPIYWMVGYDKLWLQPILCFFFLSGLLIKISTDTKKSVILRQAAILLLIVEVATNLTWAIPARFRETRYLREAEQVVQIVKPEDLIINDWDGVSVLYGTIWGKGHILNLPTSAEEYGIKSLEKVDQAIKETRDRGGQIYFLGVLDHSVQKWSESLGRRGIPYDNFEKYRDNASVVSRFKIDGEDISLRRLE